MGMDGLSIANTGVVKEATSADFANRTEQAIHAESSNSSQQIQTLNNHQSVKRKEDDESSKKKQQDEAQEEFQDGLQPEDDLTNLDEEFDIEDIENPNKDFYVKLNAKDDIIELYDSTTDRLVETISGNELTGLVKKLNMASGIFINKKV